MLFFSLLRYTQLMREQTATRILDENKASYNSIAGEFSKTRARFWDELIFLGEHAVPNMQVLDLGCGNGRFYDVLKSRQITYTGLDNSEALIEEAKKRHPEINFIVGDATKLPFTDSAFNLVYSFAVIHHIPSKKLREQFIREVARVLHTGDTFIITSWYLWQPRYIGKILITALKSIFFLTPLDVGDMMHVFGKNHTSRFLHAFTLRELTSLLTKNGFEVIGSDIIERGSGSGSKNIVLVCKKKQPAK